MSTMTSKFTGRSPSQQQSLPSKLNGIITTLGGSSPVARGQRDYSYTGGNGSPVRSSPAHPVAPSELFGRGARSSVSSSSDSDSGSVASNESSFDGDPTPAQRNGGEMNPTQKENHNILNHEESSPSRPRRCVIPSLASPRTLLYPCCHESDLNVLLMSLPASNFCLPPSSLDPLNHHSLVSLRASFALVT